MRKVRLDMEALQVDRFDVLPAERAGKGTVVGQGGQTDGCSVGDYTCFEEFTCYMGSCATGRPCQACM